MKIILISIIAAMSLISCDIPAYYNYNVTNESNKPVSYIFNGTPDTLEPGEWKPYQSKTGARFTGLIDIDAGETHGFNISVKLRSHRNDYVFYNFSPFDLHVLNTLPIDLTIKAGEYIDNGGSTELLVAADSNPNTNAKIYTNKPVFAVVTEVYQNFPIIFDWKYIDDDRIVYLIIK
ncbi:MAG: hypothetical protein FWD14_04920 [Treponema sp.]|nr:hypothetical protein [Treponema sp.]